MTMIMVSKETFFFYAAELIMSSRSVAFLEFWFNSVCTSATSNLASKAHKTSLCRVFSCQESNSQHTCLCS